MPRTLNDERRSLSPADRKALEKVLDDVYARVDKRGWSWADLSRQSGLCYATVLRIGHFDTIRPQFRTVCRLAATVGYQLQLVDIPGRQRKVS